MSQITVEDKGIARNESGLGFRAEDFLASPAAVSSRIGGMNPYALDSTAVQNMPPCVCPECGGRNNMVPLWAYPARQQTLIDQGVIPVPEVCFKNDYNGGRPVRSVSAYAQVRDGKMIREPGACEVMLFMTTCSNYARLQRMEADACDQQMRGRPVRGRQVGDVEADAEAGRFGMTSEEAHGDVFVEQVRKNGNEVSRTKRPLAVSIPGKPNTGNSPPNF